MAFSLEKRSSSYKSLSTFLCYSETKPNFKIKKKNNLKKNHYQIPNNYTLKKKRKKKC